MPGTGVAPLPEISGLTATPKPAGKLSRETPRAGGSELSVGPESGSRREKLIAAPENPTPNHPRGVVESIIKSSRTAARSASRLAYGSTSFACDPNGEKLDNRGTLDSLSKFSRKSRETANASRRHAIASLHSLELRKNRHSLPADRELRHVRTRSDSPFESSHGNFTSRGQAHARFVAALGFRG